MPKPCVGVSSFRILKANPDSFQRSAPHRAVPRKRPSCQYAGMSRSVRLQGRRSDGEAVRQAVPNLVTANGRSLRLTILLLIAYAPTSARPDSVDHRNWRTVCREGRPVAPLQRTSPSGRCRSLAGGIVARSSSCSSPPSRSRGVSEIGLTHLTGDRCFLRYVKNPDTGKRVIAAQSDI